MGANAIDKYHCPRCECMCGTSLMKPRWSTLLNFSIFVTDGKIELGFAPRKPFRPSLIFSSDVKNLFVLHLGWLRPIALHVILVAGSKHEFNCENHKWRIKKFSNLITRTNSHRHDYTDPEARTKATQVPIGIFAWLNGATTFNKTVKR
jgi:hypothetical protein